MARSRLLPIGEEEYQPEEAPPPAPAAERGASVLLFAIKTLSQKALVAAAVLTDLALVSSAFVLWLLVISGPTYWQLTGLALYAAFILAAIGMRRKS